jgi:hypothetical protein
MTCIEESEFNSLVAHHYRSPIRPMTASAAAAGGF